MFERTRHRLPIVLVLLAVLGGPALADEAQPSVVMVPANCLPYWSPTPEPVTDWNRVLSLAGCLQDVSIEAVDDPAELRVLVDLLATRMLPSLSLYAVAVQNGPGPVKLRAVYQIGMAEVSLIVRARMSIRSPQLRRELEEHLQPAIEVAVLAFAAVVHVATTDPTVAPDPVTRFMVQNARRLLHQMTDPVEENLFATPFPHR